MPVGRIYQPPQKKLINDLKSPFLESDPKKPVKRNFVLPSKKKNSDSEFLLDQNAKNKDVNGEEQQERSTDNGYDVCNGHVKRKHFESSDANGITRDCNGNLNVACEAVDDSYDSYSDTNLAENLEAVEVVETADLGEEVTNIPVTQEVIAIEIQDEPEVGTNGYDDVIHAKVQDIIGPVIVDISECLKSVKIEDNNEGQEEKVEDKEEEEEEVEEPASRVGHRWSLEPSKAPTDGVVSLPDRGKGLKNLGNTCFMNSIIQCLAHTAQLLEFCQGFSDDDKAQRALAAAAAAGAGAGKKKSTNSNITRAFSKLVMDMWDLTGAGSTGGDRYGDRYGDRVGDPSPFKREMGAFASKFLGFDQHDSQEFLQYALEGIHGELNRAEEADKKKKKQEINNNGVNSSSLLEDKVEEPAPKDPNDPDDPEAPGITPSESGRRCWRQYLKRDNSLVTDLFLGQFRSTLKCTVCDNESVTFEPFWVVSVPIPASSAGGGRTRGGYGEDGLKLQDCLDLFVKEETLDGEEKPLCERCRTRTRCTKSYAFERWPKILVVHLKRFSPGERFRSKLSNHVDVQVEGLDLGCYSQNLSVRYDLYGVSNHSGTLHGGHYTAYCRHPRRQPGLWHLYNDRMVSNASANSIISYEAYLLFFERREPPPTMDLLNGIAVVAMEDEELEEEEGEEEW